MIEVRNLVKSYEGLRALDGLDLTAPTGAVYGLVGPNGAGKSTLIRHLTGILRQDAGTVTVDGEPVYENPAVKRKIAYIPDEVFYYAQATGRDMARLYQAEYPKFDRDCYEKLGEVSMKSWERCSSWTRSGPCASSPGGSRSRRPFSWPWPCGRSW